MNAVWVWSESAKCSSKISFMISWSSLKGGSGTPSPERGDFKYLFNKVRNDSDDLKPGKKDVQLPKTNRGHLDGASPWLVQIGKNRKPLAQLDLRLVLLPRAEG